MIITRTPYRISFFGGGTDYPKWFETHGGSVLSTTIDKYCYITCRNLPSFFPHKHRFVYSKIENVTDINQIEHPAIKGVLQFLSWQDQGLEIHHDGDLPARSGLGSSSSFTVGLINSLYALNGKRRSNFQLANDAIHIEQNIINESVGSQDQVAAAYGGLNRIDFFQNGTFRVSPVILGRNRLREIQEHLLLFYTGESRIASSIAKSQIENIESKADLYSSMKKTVDTAIDILSSDEVNICEFGSLLNESWALKRQMSDLITNSNIDWMYTEALKNGAIGGKVLGAGGGGFFLVFAAPKNHFKIKMALSNYLEVPFEFENTGSTVTMYSP
jgi:D-glycero-alpha-D-manno-heptose-7-phosphate kinase